MARPIKDTPILSGKDAERFVEHMLRSEERKETAEEREKRLEAYKTAMQIFVDR
jgi:hypothetical protein